MIDKIPELGIGIIYFSGFRDVVESNSDLINLIEIEPQTFWLKDRTELGSFVFNEEEIQYLDDLDIPKVFHGVGYPVAGSFPPDTDHVPLLNKMIHRLEPNWMSEHLSFNNVNLGGEVINTNFLLPPLQTMEGLELASKNIREYQTCFDLPFAFETGVNYLRQQEFEMSDAAFINGLTERTEAHILLDIHNLLANEKNGRQPLTEFLNCIDLNRVIHIHIAGGFSYNGYYLDAHSGVVSAELFGLLEDIVTKLPHLKGITFEMLPEYISSVPKKAIRTQLELMNTIWDKRGTRRCQYSRTQPSPVKEFTSTPTVCEWEHTLGCLVLNKPQCLREGLLKDTLQKDGGIAIIRTLIEKFRASQLVSTLRLTCRYVMLKHGVEELNRQFQNFWKVSNPRLFPAENGLLFGEFLLEQEEEDLLLKDIVRYEFTSLKTLLDNHERTILLRYNPVELVALLSDRQLPEELVAGNYEVVIEPVADETVDGFSGVYHS